VKPVGSVRNASSFLSRRCRFLTALSLPLGVRSGLLQGGQARQDVFGLNSLLGVIQDAVSRSYFDRWPCRRIESNLPQNRNGCAGKMVKPSDRLSIGCPFRCAIGCLELGFLLPTQECRGPDPYSAGGFFSCPVGKQRDYRLFLC
jgi:hypothetical protein